VIFCLSAVVLSTASRLHSVPRAVMLMHNVEKVCNVVITHMIMHVANTLYTL
jgi:hypothetical protein